MSYTTPRTWVAGETVTAALLNTHLRDQILETSTAKVTTIADLVFATGANAFARYPGSKYKTADESVNNSTTLQDDDHLSFAIAANEVYALDYFFYFTVASGDPGFKWTFTVPASCTGFHMVHGYLSAAIDTGTTNGANNTIGVWTIAGSVQHNTSGITSTLFSGKGVIINGANAGTVQLQWAQRTAVASNLTLKIGSYLNLKRIA